MMAGDVRSGVRSNFFAVCQWISRFAVANLLWLGLAVLGLGVGGFFPSTAAMFALIRRWLLAEPEEDVRPLATAWKSYRDSFWAANALGYFLAGIGYLLYLDVRLFAGSGSGAAPLLLAISLAACLVYALVLAYIGPVFVHLELRWYEQIRVAAALGVSHPFSALYLLVIWGGMYLVFWQVPGLVVFFGGSVPAAFAMWQLLSMISRQERRSVTASAAGP